MAGIFGSGRTSAPPVLATSLRLTTSLGGKPRPIIYGQARIAPNIIDYAGFRASPVTQSGGKGGVLDGGGGKGQPTGYNYTVSLIASLGEQISQVLTIYNGSAVDCITAPSAGVLAALAAIGIVPTTGNTYSIEFHYGAPGQAVSAYWSSAFPARALAYRGQALAVFPNLGLGNSPTLPNFNFEVLGVINSDVPALGPDANASDVIPDLLTNAVYG
ncbi:MAG: hypothetical protein M3O03_09005, partial [Pseudomonadota bacterium]|nr:hypothetical protein [Pseudomonadota bacterium]